jgi:hypothetical protein
MKLRQRLDVRDWVRQNRRVLHTTRSSRLQSLYREVNERVAGISAPYAQVREMEFLCECGRSDCFERVVLARDEYEALRGDAHRFVLFPGHEVDELERVLTRTDTFVVVEPQPAV